MKPDPEDPAENRVGHSLQLNALNGPGHDTGAKKGRSIKATLSHALRLNIYSVYYTHLESYSRH